MDEKKTGNIIIVCIVTHTGKTRSLARPLLPSINLYSP